MIELFPLFAVILAGVITGGITSSYIPWWGAALIGLFVFVIGILVLVAHDEAMTRAADPCG